MKRIIDLFSKPKPDIVKPIKKADYLSTYIKPAVVQRTTLEPVNTNGIESREMTPEEIAEYFHVIKSMTGSFKVVKPKTPEEELADKVLGTKNSHL